MKSLIVFLTYYFFLEVIEYIDYAFIGGYDITLKRTTSSVVKVYIKGKEKNIQREQ